MWNNIGGKIKVLAKVIFWIGAIAAVIAAISQFVLAGEADSGIPILTGFLTLILGPLFAWISSFLLVGFGQLIQNTDRIVYDIENTRK